MSLADQIKNSKEALLALGFAFLVGSALTIGAINYLDLPDRVQILEANVAENRSDIREVDAEFNAFLDRFDRFLCLRAVEQGTADPFECEDGGPARGRR